MQPAKLVAALALLLLSGAGARAGDQVSPSVTIRDIDRLSADGVRGYHDLGLTRLAIFDGRIADAKRLVAEAAAAFEQARRDPGVALPEEAPAAAAADPAAIEAETARLNAAKQENSAKVYAGHAPNDAAAAAFDAAAAERAAAVANAAKQESAARAAAQPERWLLVDAEMGLADGFAADPGKAAAVAEADRALAAGNRTGAMATLQRAGVRDETLVAVVPLERTSADVRRAAALIDGGKYYEASQLLRRVQASVRLVDAAGKP